MSGTENQGNADGQANGDTNQAQSTTDTASAATDSVANEAQDAGAIVGSGDTAVGSTEDGAAATQESTSTVGGLSGAQTDSETADQTAETQEQAPRPPVLIVPTVGRVVWYHPTDEQVALRGFAKHGDQPFVGQIAYVHDDYKVNLTVHDHNGTQFAATDVYLSPCDEEVPADTAYAEWMGYQLGQVLKAA